MIKNNEKIERAIQQAKVKSNEKLEKALQYAKVSNQIEGKNVSDEVIDLVRALHTNQITKEEFDEEVMRRINSKYKENN